MRPGVPDLSDDAAKEAVSLNAKGPEGIFLSEYERGEIGVGKARMSQCCKSPTRVDLRGRAPGGYLLRCFVNIRMT